MVWHSRETGVCMFHSFCGGVMVFKFSRGLYMVSKFSEPSDGGGHRTHNVSALLLVVKCILSAVILAIVNSSSAFQFHSCWPTDQSFAFLQNRLSKNKGENMNGQCQRCFVICFCFCLERLIMQEDKRQHQIQQSTLILPSTSFWLQKPFIYCFRSVRKKNSGVMEKQFFVCSCSGGGGFWPLDTLNQDTQIVLPNMKPAERDVMVQQ